MEASRRRLREGRAPDHARGGARSSHGIKNASLASHAGETDAPNLPLERTGRTASRADAPGRPGVDGNVTEFDLSSLKATSSRS